MNTFRKILAVVIIFTAGYFLGQSQIISQNFNSGALPNNIQNINQTNQSDKVLISLAFDQNNTSLYSRDWQANLSLLAVTKNLAEENNLAFEIKDYAEMGVLITQIGDKINGQDNKYWQYWVNQQQPLISADKYILQPQDIVEWKFEASQM